MSEYKSDKIEIKASAQAVFDRLSNPENLKTALEAKDADNVLTPEQRAQLESIKVTSDSLSLPGGPVGQITLRITRLEEPTLIHFEGEGTPVPLSLDFVIDPVDDSRCMAEAVIDLELPAMLRPMVGPTLKKMAAQFGNLLANLPYA